MLVRKPKLKSSNEEAPIVCSRDGQSKSNKEQFISSNEHSNTTCTKNKGNKNCQAEKHDMWPVKPAKDMHSNGPAVPIQNQMSQKSKIVAQEDDKNCQSTKYYGSVCADKKCQATKCYKKVDRNCQTSDVWPEIPEMDIQIPKPAIRRLCNDKNCQCTRCYNYKKKSPLRPMYGYDKSCQSANMCFDKKNK